MNMSVGTMVANDSQYVCCHEDLIQDHSRKIEALEVKADYKAQRIDELNNKMDKLNDKFDDVLEKFNDLTTKSVEDDKELEIRLKAIETEVELNRQRSDRLLVIVGLVLACLTFYFNYLR